MPELVHDHISHDTVEALEQLLEAARAGAIRRLIFGAILQRRRYLVNIAGDVARDPTFARGVCGAIEDELRNMIHQKAGSDTTLSERGIAAGQECAPTIGPNNT